MIKLVRLSKKDNEKFQEFCREGEVSSLNIENFATEQISNNIEIDENKIFKNKFELGRYLCEKLKDIPNINNKIWHFLVIVYCQQLLNNKLKNGIGERGRFCIDDSKSYYPFTHLLKPVFDFYKLYNKETGLIKFLLLNPVNESGGLLLGTLKRRDIMKNRRFIEVSKKIFYDGKRKEIKRGSIKAIERLIDLFKQYERTYDLYSMPSEIILERLINKHKEFDKFKADFLSKSF